MTNGTVSGKQFLAFGQYFRGFWGIGGLHFQQPKHIIGINVHYSVGVNRTASPLSAAPDAVIKGFGRAWWKVFQSSSTFSKTACAYAADAGEILVKSALVNV